MSLITQIVVQSNNKKRCNVFVDNEFFCGMSVETALKLRLKVGTELDKAKLNEILDEKERSDALNKSVEYISKYLKSKRQVKEYLIKKGYSEEIAYYCIDKLKEYGYIDDQKFSERYIESVSKTNGKHLVEYKLMMKGVRKEDIEKAYQNVNVDSKVNAKEVAEKYLKNKEKTKENIAKAYRYLVGRGFSYDDVNYALKDVSEEED